MNPMKPQLLWFKRDLRVHDHAPLCQAAAQGPVLAVYVYEPEVIHAPDYAVQHLNFTNECLQELQTQLHALGIPLIFRHGEMCEVLQKRVLKPCGATKKPATASPTSATCAWLAGVAPKAWLGMNRPTTVWCAD
jgi:deoxyribodipyrimidine photolyase